MGSNRIYNFLHSKGNHNHKQDKKNLWTGGKKKMFANHVTDKGLISKIYKQLMLPGLPWWLRQ